MHTLVTESSSRSGFYGWTDTLKGVHYGPGSIKTALPKLLKQLGVKKALIVTGKTLNEKTDVVRKIEAILTEHEAYGSTFFEIGQHAPIAGIRKGIQQYKEHGCDFIVAVGGGSPIDASKAILYNIQQELGGNTPPQIAIPTTLSAAEYSIGAGFTDETGHKTAVSSAELAPAGVILDAELTLATPQRLWLSTGIRALDHAVENLYRPGMPYPIKVLCYTAMADLFKFLPESKVDPSSIEIRQRLQLASWLSLWPIKLEQYSALGLSHSLGHKLGARYGIPHGITSCLTLAPTVKLYSQVGSKEDKQALASALFYLNQPSTGSIEGDALRVSSLINDLVVKLGLHSTLGEYKVPRTDLSSIANGSLGRENHPLHPMVVKVLESLYDSAESRN